MQGILVFPMMRPDITEETELRTAEGESIKENVNIATTDQYTLQLLTVSRKF